MRHETIFARGNEAGNTPLKVLLLRELRELRGAKIAALGRKIKIGVHDRLENIRRR
jgi:hypothetical protein